MGGENEKVAKCVAGNAVDGYIDARIEVGEDGTIGASVDGGSRWQMGQQIEVLLRAGPKHPLKRSWLGAREGCGLSFCSSIMIPKWRRQML